jgi:hypothetical protein
MKLGKLKNAQLSKQSHEIGFVQRVQLIKFKNAKSIVTILHISILLVLATIFNSLIYLSAFVNCKTINCKYFFILETTENLSITMILPSIQGQKIKIYDYFKSFSGDDIVSLKPKTIITKKG